MDSLVDKGSTLIGRLIKALKAELVKLADFCPYGQVILAILSFAALNLVFTFWMSVFIFASLLVHEAGHVFSSWYKKVKVTGVYLFPLSGFCSSDMKTSKQRIFICIAGPAFSIIFSLFFWIVFHFTKESVYGFCCFANAWVALYNLYPEGHRDGFKVKTIIFSKKIRLLSRILYSAICLLIVFLGFAAIFYTFLNNFTFIREYDIFRPIFQEPLNHVIKFFENIFKP